MTALEFESLFDALPSPYMVLDRNFDFVAVNSAYERAVMRRRDDLVGGNLFIHFPNEGEGGRRLRESLQRVLDTGESDTIAYIPYEIGLPEEQGGGMEIRYWTAIHTPLGIADGRVCYVVQNTVDVTELVKLKEAASLPFRTLSGEIALVERAREAERAYAASLSESADFRRLFQQAPSMIAVLQGPGHVFTFANDAFLRFIGWRDVLGLSFRECLPEIDGQGFVEIMDEVYRKGKPYSGEGLRIVVRQAPEEHPQVAYLDVSYHPIRDAAGETTGVFVQGADRTEHFNALQRQRLLVDELNHRVKNTLSTVQSIARQSFRAPDMLQARQAFEARIVALSNAHNVLSERLWETVKLSVLLVQELMPYEPQQTRVEGPDVDLNPKAAIAFAMIFHELATNAAKYGALSSADGAVFVNWRRTNAEGPSAFEFVWRESGGPLICGPIRRGFGMRMMHRIVEGELEGRLDLDLAASGLIFRMEIPMGEVEACDGCGKD